MKILFTLFLVATLSLTANAQDIINKYGSGGKFLINNSNGVTEFELRETIFNDAELVIGKNTVNVGNQDVWMLNVQSKAIGPFVSLAGLENSTGGPQLWFQKARFADPNLLPSLAGDAVGEIIFSGYQGSTFHSVAAITSKIIAPGTTQPSADLKFWTSTIDAGTAVRMTIKDDGTLVIPDLDINANAYVLVDADGNLYSSTSPPAPNGPNKSSVIEQLKSENEMLKKRLEKLEAIVEELLKQ